MTRETHTCWRGENNEELLHQKGADLFYVPLSNITRAVLRELGKAIEDALADELVQAANEANRRK